MTKSKRRSEIVRHFAAFFFGVVVLAGGAACAHDAPPAQSAESAPANAEPSGTAAPSGDVQREGGASVFVVHEVEDFEAFRKYFEEGEAERTKAGVLGYLLSRLHDERVIIHMFAKDVKEVEAALNSPGLQEYLARKGAPDASLVWLTVDESVTIPASPPAGKTWSLFFKLKTSDVAALKKAFDGLAKVYAEQGVIGAGLHRSTSQDGLVVLHFMGTDREKLNALPNRPEFIELLGLAGGSATAVGLLGEDVARKRP